MIHTRKKLMELLPGDDLYHKLTSNLYNNDSRDVITRLFPQMFPNMPIEKHYIEMTRRKQGRFAIAWKGVFLTEDKIVGVLESKAKQGLNLDIVRDTEFAYIENNQLKIERNYLFTWGHGEKKEIHSSTNEIYSMDVDDVYNLRKKLERIDRELDKVTHQDLAKQLLKQKVKRF